MDQYHPSQIFIFLQLGTISLALMISLVSVKPQQKIHYLLALLVFMSLLSIMNEGKRLNQLSDRISNKHNLFSKHNLTLQEKNKIQIYKNENSPLYQEFYQHHVKKSSSILFIQGNTGEDKEHFFLSYKAYLNQQDIPCLYQNFNEIRDKFQDFHFVQSLKQQIIEINHKNKQPFIIIYTDRNFSHNHVTLQNILDVYFETNVAIILISDLFDIADNCQSKFQSLSQLQKLMVYKDFKSIIDNPLYANETYKMNKFHFYNQEECKDIQFTPSMNDWLEIYKSMGLDQFCREYKKKITHLIQQNTHLQQVLTFYHSKDMEQNKHFCSLFESQQNDKKDELDKNEIQESKNKQVQQALSFALSKQILAIQNRTIYVEQEFIKAYIEKKFSSV